MADMKLKTLLVAVAAVLGIGGSAAAYQMAASPASPVKTTAAHQRVAQAQSQAPKVEIPKILPVTRFEWAPCKPPAELKGDECVSQIVQTVVLPSSSSGSSSGGGSHEAEHSGGGGGGDDASEPEHSGGDDEGEDDHEDNGGDDHEVDD